MLAAIWAQDEAGLIGKQEHLPWHLPSDLKFFKQMTESNTLIMGRRTFEGMGGRPLPNRKTIVLTRDLTYQAQGVDVMHTLDDVLAYEKEFEGITFVAGGSMIYEEFLPYCTVLYRTLIHHTFEGDTYFPTVDWTQWSLINLSEGEQDEKNLYPFQFETYHRRNQSEQ
ncbi:dihydrofolate reductase [Enterococcus phoeniculicola]|jgi:dihydrofolate reductase|uniref:Dihydrofolate reductase n=1 Tax=Enterococcus phoeniculicola ATCC BAA-412 TaxID=1158610 RepID=R3TPQ8_9ENTE|nr:dihydrofolate reductase [Enterococcus phoeniculicola]EOL43058.1 dihydrofolate reductase [Enterococcus phoeniculicola ATCC BAA-412]EOT76584.1 dihydrofolate reductase [Enterococcus phoeniculicola ATCC BAA-412]OJG72155.1 dihydrofolate reductase [Enterococcus phoeniculicola]